MPPTEDLPAPLTLEDLAEAFPHIPPECGTALIQSAVLCLEGQGHQSGAVLTVHGSFNTAFRLLWAMDVTDAMRRYWNDPDETAEQGGLRPGPADASLPDAPHRAGTIAERNWL
jgi:hypothetical protein